MINFTIEKFEYPWSKLKDNFGYKSKSVKETYYEELKKYQYDEVMLAVSSTICSYSCSYVPFPPLAEIFKALRSSSITPIRDQIKYDYNLGIDKGIDIARMCVEQIKTHHPELYHKYSTNEVRECGSQLSHMIRKLGVTEQAAISITKMFLKELPRLPDCNDFYHYYYILLNNSRNREANNETIIQDDSEQES